MKILFLILTYLIGVSKLKAQQTVQQALSYYPLQVGNKWQYHYLYYETIAGDSGYVNVTVTGDTLMNNHHWYQILKHHYFQQVDSLGNLKSTDVKFSYERVDSATANVYKKTYSGEKLQDSLMMRKGETLNIIPGLEMTTCYDTTSWRVFGGIQHVKLMHWFNGIFQSRYYSLVKGIGITRNYYNAEDTNGDLDTLVYAKINGKEYGTFVDTPINETFLSSHPSSFRLYQNYPNPFNPTTIIRYKLTHSGPVRLAVYNVTGQKVSMLVDTRQTAGVHQAIFNASQLASGVYFYRLQAGDKVLVKKMLVIK